MIYDIRRKSDRKVIRIMFFFIKNKNLILFSTTSEIQISLLLIEKIKIFFISLSARILYKYK